MENLLTAKKNQIKMLSARGYSISAAEMQLLNMDLQTFVATYGDREGKLTKVIEKLHQQYVSQTDPNKAAIVFYARKGKAQIGVEEIRPLLLLYQNKNYSEVILVVDGVLSTTARQNLAVISNIQIFHLENDLSYVPIDHVLVDKHRLLSQDEVNRLVADSNTPPNKFPTINNTDAIVRYYGWPIGGVVQIIRDDSQISLLNPISVQYRYIVANPMPKTA